MFEHKSHPLLPTTLFLQRMARTLLIASTIVLAALATGALGYHHFEGLKWLDAFLNAAMILTGMGPVNPVMTDAGKLFATCYALFSGVLFLTIAAVFFAPVAHRLIHRFHLELIETGDDRTTKEQ